jgi:glycosyltransferase involved in cell wall biosynthesis
MMWHAAQWSRAIITNSQTTTNDVIKYLGVPAAKCHTIHLAVEDSFKPATSEQIKAIKAKYKITKPYLFFVNAWRPHKGLPELAQAFTHLKRDDVQLVLGGKPNPAFPDVEQAVVTAQKTNPNIVTTGFIDDADLPVLYSGAEVYINPSHYEGFGLGLLEAMACGAPVIAADNACMQEIGGNAATYFKTGDTNNLAANIQKVLDDKTSRETFIKKGFARIKAFSFNRMAQQTLDVFKQVLK